MPLLIGPSYYNFTDITHALVEANACKIVHDQVDILTQLNIWLTDKQQREISGQQALSVVNKNTGAIERSLDQIALV
jgi:3-deoxy-D-manno-octulosonic-acid transferase